MPCDLSGKLYKRKSTSPLGRRPAPDLTQRRSPVVPAAVTTVVVAVSVLIFVTGTARFAWAITAFNGLPEQVFQIVGRKKSNWLVLILVAASRHVVLVVRSAAESQESDCSFRRWLTAVSRHRPPPERGVQRAPRAAVSVGPAEPTVAEVEPGGRGPLLDLPPVPLPPPAGGGDQKARSLAGRAALSLALLAGAGFLAVGVLVAIVGINVLLFQAGCVQIYLVLAALAVVVSLGRGVVAAQAADPGRGGGPGGGRTRAPRRDRPAGGGRRHRPPDRIVVVPAVNAYVREFGPMLGFWCPRLGPSPSARRCSTCSTSRSCGRCSPTSSATRRRRHPARGR